MATKELHPSFAQKRSRRAPDPKADPRLSLWERMIAFAVAEAKKTNQGIPTDLAILARWWIAEFQPSKKDKDEWERSFACACQWLSLDAVTYRKRVLHSIDRALQAKFLEEMNLVVYHRRAAVLSCAGAPTAIAKQFILPLVASLTYDEVAGVETMDFFPDDVDANPDDPMNDGQHAPQTAA